MSNMIWFACTVATLILWSATCLLYKAGIQKEREEHTCLKYSVSIGIVFFVIALACLILRDEPFSIWESAIRYWPMTLFGIVFYSFAMAMDSVSTDPMLAVYPVLVMIGGRLIMRERVSMKQYVCLASMVAGSVLIVADALG